MNEPKAAIIYLCWADEPKKYLADALSAISRQSYGRQYLSLIIVYNGPREGEESQIDFIRSEINRRAAELPETNILEPGSNIGFSAGNNFGAKYAVEHGADYVFLHNSDGFLGNSAIEELVKVMEKDKDIGECQPLVRLFPERDLINTAGNALHFLGIGYCSHYREPVRKFAEFSEVGYVSGSSAFMRADMLKKFGFWDEDFYLYHEDSEYSLRLKIRGYKIGLAGQADFYHIYNFSDKPRKLFWIERNRHALKLVFYKWPTLVLLLPAEILYNLGLVVLSLAGGWFTELINVYKYWFKPANWRGWLARRKIAQQERVISDRKILSGTTSMISFGEMKIPAIFRVCATTVFTIYYFLLKILIWW